MNKLTKSAIAGAAGIALLLGGAGSLAYWNSSATVGGATITAGELTIDAVGSAVQKYTGTTEDVVLIVPGDSVTVTQAVTVTATGDHMRAKLEIDQDTLVGSLKDDGLITSVTVTAYDSLGGEITDLLDMTKAEAASIKSVEVVVVFPTTVGDTDGTEGQDGELLLGALKVKLTQLAP